MVGANRKTGIDLIGEVPWGTHLCQFYQTREDLIDILVPYFKAGLENNEFCMWVTSEPLGMEEAKRAMRRAVPQFDLYLQKGQIEIIPHTEWYLKDGTFDLNRVLDAWVDKLNRALAKGYDGMRLTGNTAWLEKRDWKSFADYEEAIDNAIGKHRMLAICTYSLDKCGASEIIDVVSNHQFALIRREGEWELIESSERKQAEEKLKQIAEGWKVTFDSITDLVSIQDKDFRLLRVNKAFADTFKMEPEELIGKPCYEIVHGTGEPWPGCPHKQALETKKPVTKEFFEPQLGIHLEASASPIFSEKGEVIGTVHITKDITERKCAEEALQESEDKFKKLFEFAPDGYYLNDLKGNFVDSNKAAEELVGYKRGELIGKSFLKLRLLSSKQIPKAAALLTKNAMGQPTGPDEFILNRKDGSRVPVEIMTFPVKIKDHALVLGIARDITKRKKAEEALRESEIKFRGFVENLDGIAVRGDMEGKPEFLIGKLEDITGYTWEDFSKKGLKWFDIIHPDDKKELTEEGLKDAASGKSIDREYRIVRKDGSIRWVSQRISPQMKENGTPEFFQGIIMDITDRKQADETIKNLAKFPSENKNPVMRISKDGTLTYANSASSQLLKTWKCQAGQRVPEDIQQSIQDAMSSNLGKTIEITIEDCICSLTVIPVKDAGYANLYGLDITKRKQAENQIKQRLEFEKTISEISSRFVGVHNIDDSINASLADMGRLSGAGRAYLFLFNEDSATMDNTHEWCAEGVNPQIDDLRNLPMETFPWWMKKLKKGEVIRIMDVSKLPEEAKAEKETLDAQDIKSLLVLPLYVRRKLAGFMGFDNVMETREWNDDDLALLRTSSEIIGNAIERALAEDLISKQVRELRKLDRMKNEFLSVVSHELRTPLTPIQAYIDLLQSGEY
ncbi:MAG: PAS domain S-box protein, partial [Candidatus Altiarchaeales archaeon]|nr:PAS domain S-box protein [Candidatus Altiarchaeales archaeon]